MYLVATFEQSPDLELALTSLEQKRIAREQMLAVTLDLNKEERKLFDTLHRADGFSLMDGAMLCCALFMSLGTAIGFGLAWGPVIWGLIGMVGGFVIGLVCDLLIWQKKRTGITLKKPTRQMSEVVLMIQCPDEQVEMIQQLLWDHHALAIGTVKVPATAGSTA